MYALKIVKRKVGGELFDRLLIAVVDQPLAESNG
jgi:hypothetical protein